MIFQILQGVGDFQGAHRAACQKTSIIIMERSAIFTPHPFLSIVFLQEKWGFTATLRPTKSLFANP
jgi:hypothetical protein